jgi:hypothetical protein
MPHKLEELLNASAEDIMDAIFMGFRAQVDVKGKLAELYLHRYLGNLRDKGILESLEWRDRDGTPDFEIKYNDKKYLIECKNVRNEIYKTPYPSYKVEIQRTRNSKDGSNTRSYHINYFDILAVCTFNQSGKWEFMFISSDKLEAVGENSDFLKIMQRVPIHVADPWTEDLIKVLEELEKYSKYR